MARIRSLKPEFWTDEKLSLLDPTTRLVFLGLISMADDAGRLVDNVKLLDGQLFPNTDDTCRDALDTLARIARVIRYRSESGQQLIQIANWARHQKVDNPAKYVLPGPETAVVTQPAVPPAVASPSAPPDAPPSRESSEDRARVSRSDLLPTTPDLRSPINDPQVVAAAAIALSVCANKGLAEHPDRPQRVPRIMGTSGRSHEAASAILHAGVPLAFAESRVYALAKSHNAEGEVRTLKYFTDAVVRAWEEQCEAEQADSASPPVVSLTDRRPPRRSTVATRTFDNAVRALKDLP